MAYKSYIPLEKLDVYRLAILLEEVSWKIYEKLDWRMKKINGDQFIESTDSVGANVAEGYGRFHYLDKIRFYYNARGSLLESRHWFNLLGGRKFIAKADGEQYLSIYKELRPALNALISSLMKIKQGSKIPLIS